MCFQRVDGHNSDGDEFGICWQEPNTSGHASSEVRMARNSLPDYWWSSGRDSIKRLEHETLNFGTPVDRILVREML